MQLWMVEVDVQDCDEPIQMRVPADSENMAISMAKTQAYEDGLEFLGARIMRSMTIEQVRAELRRMN